ncbi:MAG: SDR family oxidoreductase [Pseudolabrys sp.]|nr:SDR family oxidoreductase [Pseudolabrys sp.]MBV9956657.1 SDR family oxidoreductase [Pseudolabrys sp.]
MSRLDGKVILVSGAKGAIGSAIGAAVTRAGGRALGADIAAGADHQLDVTSEADWRRVTQSLDRLDGLVNAAGIVALGTVEQLDFALWKKVLAVNLDGTFLGCKAAMPLLRKQGGAIVNLSSVSGLVGGHNLAAYNASKGGVSLLTKSVALHGARCNPPVRCNAICPAFVEGPMADAMIAGAKHPERARDAMTAAVPLSRLGKADEIAALCVYLLSDDAAFVTGADVPIDGGLTAR